MAGIVVPAGAELTIDHVADGGPAHPGRRLHTVVYGVHRRPATIPPRPGMPESASITIPVDEWKAGRVNECHTALAEAALVTIGARADPAPTWCEGLYTAMAQVRVTTDIEWLRTVADTDARSTVEQALVVIACDAMRCGPYDIPGWSTRLRAIAHTAARFSFDRGARVTLRGCGGNRLEILVHLRRRRLGEQVEGDDYPAGTMTAHPTLEGAVARWRGRAGRTP